MKYILNNDNLEVVGKQYLNGVGNYTGDTTNASDLATVINNKAGKTDIVTPNWNAQKGEAGYIENKPFERKNIEPFISNNEVVYNTPDLMDVYIQCYDSIYSFPFGYDDDGFFIESEKEIYIPEDSVSIKAVRRYEYEMRVQSLNSELDVNDIPKCITVFYVDRKLNQSDIDNTVIKTTPQTLSNADKNQALTNLGIDPVALKYTINPLVLNYEAAAQAGEDMKLPEDLANIVLTDGKFNQSVLNMIIGWDGQGYYRVSAYDNLIEDLKDYPHPTILCGNMVYELDIDSLVFDYQ